MPIQFITPSIISSVANTQVTGTITASQIATVNANTITSGSIPLAQVPQLTSAKMPTGSVVQTIFTRSESTTAFSTTSSSTVNVSALEATITPTSSSNRILVKVCMAVGINGWSAGQCRFGLTRNGSEIFGPFNSLENYGADAGNGAYDGNSFVHFMYLDSPNTTSSTTYAPRLGSSNGDAVYINRYFGSNAQRGISYISVQEISA
jgi:hypothetical protein